jgi:hypothetical protein
MRQASPAGLFRAETFLPFLRHLPQARRRAPPPMLRALLTLLLLSACTVLRAEPPTAPYAGAQLRFAEAELDGAIAALRINDHARARQLAAQAQLDARLAWGMTRSPFVRRAALELARRAERLRSRGVLAGGVASGALITP